MSQGNYSVMPHDETPRKTALLLIDLINDYEFEGGEKVRQSVERMLPQLELLLERARSSGAAVIYANDNVGRWRSSFDDVIAHATNGGSKAAAIVEALMPRRKDYLVLKPGHSCFHATPLEIILRELRVERLVLTGQLVNSCVFFTAHDAHMRGFELVVPSDAVAAIDDEDIPPTLQQLEKLLHADVRPCAEIEL